MQPGKEYSYFVYYPFGYDGQMKVNEIAGYGNHYKFRQREYDPRLGKFWSVDPIIEKYPSIAPYTFAEDRVIDGLDLEGLEYVTFHIYVNLHNGTVTAIVITTDYDLKNKDTKGPGVEYDYIDNSTGKTFMTDFTKNIHGIYEGPWNPRVP